MDRMTLERLPLWIGGRAIRRTRRAMEKSPIPRRAKSSATFRSLTQIDVDVAVEAAMAALPAWRAAPALRRARS